MYKMSVEERQELVAWLLDVIEEDARDLRRELEANSLYWAETEAASVEKHVKEVIEHARVLAFFKADFIAAE